ncbi:hypothetical protein GLYMA_19G092166v4 [Glycine max]|nr:hypothetical protein GLYMA_19G092166v4 [Glycine max]
MPLLSLHGTACNACRLIVPIVNQFLPGACLAAEKNLRVFLKHDRVFRHS